MSLLNKQVAVSRILKSQNLLLKSSGFLSARTQMFVVEKGPITTCGGGVYFECGALTKRFHQGALRSSTCDAQFEDLIRASI